MKDLIQNPLQQFRSGFPKSPASGQSRQMENCSKPVTDTSRGVGWLAIRSPWVAEDGKTWWSVGYSGHDISHEIL